MIAVLCHSLGGNIQQDAARVKNMRTIVPPNTADIYRRSITRPRIDHEVQNCGLHISQITYTLGNDEGRHVSGGKERGLRDDPFVIMRMATTSLLFLGIDRVELTLSLDRDF